MVFLFVASVYVVCHVVYMALGTSERQPWDGGVTFSQKFGYHNAMLGKQLDHSHILNL